MSDHGPNPAQQALIEATEGIHVVDAGPGTGKTYTITRRYATLIDHPGVEPEDVLLVTFTENAATEMKDRVVGHCEYSMAALRDAPINTFHGFCNQFLRQYGFEAPTILGIDDRLTASVDLLENEVLETQRFETFIAAFAAGHPEHEEFLRALTDRTDLLELVKELAAKGIIPTSEGWFRHGERYLDGDLEAFRELFDAANEPGEGANGPTQSDLRDSLSGFRSNTHLPDAPGEEELRDGYPSIDDTWAAAAFEEDRSALKAFVHDVYFEYLEFALARNYLNFQFLQILAFAVLCEDHTAREAVNFEYVMVDEFQDTSEIQFKLAVLLADEPNLCVVGDWKQSIYSFQYASVENLRRFETRLRRYKQELNGDHDRITYPVDDVTEHTLTRNYRATQSLIEFSEHALRTPATQREDVVLDEAITRLDADTDHDHSRIEAYTSEGEYDAILARIQAMVGDMDYAVEDEDGTLRAPTYDDIAVLTRTRSFGRDLQSKAEEYAIPTAYEGGVELYDSDQALLLLAWLRILTDTHADRGWAVVLEEAGYTLDEVRHLLDTGDYPEEMVTFRAALARRETIGAVTHQVMERYGFEDAYADALVEELQSIFDGTHHAPGDIVRFLERSHARDATVDVADNPGGDAVTVQTIHAAKGLEHPIVIMANMNRYSFPPSGGGGSPIRFEEPVGIRQTKLYASPHGDPHRYDNWRHQILSACFDPEYDEERRLLYVAITRAESHVVFTAGPEPSPLFEGLPLDAEPIDPVVEPGEGPPTTQTRLQVRIPSPEIPAGQSPHSLMDDSVFEDVEEGRGREFGAAVHDFAEVYADGARVDPQNDHERNVTAFLDGLPGEIRAEEHVYLPLTVDGHKVSIAGIIDLLHITDDRVEIVDYKTDLNRHAASEYRKQLSVYYHVVSEAFPDRDVRCGIFWTVGGNLEDVDPMSIDAITNLVAIESRSSDGAFEDRVL